MDQATLRFVIQLGIIGFTFFMLINASALLVLAERKIMGFMQQRYGPYLVGPHGILQPLADILKLLFKEELRPKDADKWLFTLAPIISVTAAFAAFAAVPWGAETTFFGLLDTPVKLGVADVNVAVLVVFAITSMGVYGIVLAGWSSTAMSSRMRQRWHRSSCSPGRCRCARWSMRRAGTGLDSSRAGICSCSRWASSST